ncbi:subtilisin-like protein [Lactarius akahatsu]|uniref:tripeptidyl-peptidase II n=1 Tax=Lactarius akahatsu TaxID=416441 RepID=A0AAD4L7T4_9AGAM|nr:subtilisin-like protein [Lactarius akahatsu]
MPFPNFATPLAPSWHDIDVKHTWNSIPPNWEALGHPPNGTTVDLHVALKPHNENALSDALYKVSDPRSPEHVLSNVPPRTMHSHVLLLRCGYGAHLSKEQVAQLVAPHPNALELINSWLRHYAVPSSSISTTHGGSWLKLTGVPVSKANELLGASYQVYRRIGTNDSTILRTVGYGLPSVLHAHVQTVIPATYFASTGTLRQTPRRRTVRATEDVSSRELVTVLPSRDDDDDDDDDDGIEPSDLRWMYGTAEYVPAAMDRNLIGITGHLNDHPSPEDLKAFMTECRMDAEDATYEVALINGGGYDSSHPASEANLGMQYSQAIAYPTPHTFYSTGGEIYIYNNQPGANDVWLAWLVYMLGQTNVPQTISTPYGDTENDLPLEYTTTLCNLFAQLGLRGASVIFASGNDGVGGGNCLADDGSGRVEFIPYFPASCPYVTSVGGTTGYPEVAAPLSGGGFSNHFPRPVYQNVVVPPFLQQLDSQYHGSYNAEGRGIPDISAQALKYFIIVDDKGFFTDGTSCSAPTVAGIISLLNDYRLATGRKPLGFLNPWLYGLGIDGLNDITSGSNPGCDTDGFTAIVGWDPVTGLGTPDFVALKQTLDHMDEGEGDATHNKGIRATFSERLNNSDMAVLLA